MVLLFMLFQVDNNKIIFSNVYTKIYNDTNKSARENYLKEKIFEEYLYLKSIENDQNIVIQNNLPINLLSENYLEKNYYQNLNNFNKGTPIKYEGITIINNDQLFLSEKNAYWKYYLGYCFVLLCEEDENLQMAMNFLSIIEMFLNIDNIKNLEYLIFLLDCLLPSGQLIFMTLDLAKHLVSQGNFNS